LQNIKHRFLCVWLSLIPTDHYVSQFLTGDGNFKAKLYSFKLVPSPLCKFSFSDDEVEQTTHHIFWECCLWHDERKLVLDSVMAKSGAVYYSDLVATRANYHAFRRFCNTYHWTRTQKLLTH
jgi:hypothetical protein